MSESSAPFREEYPQVVPGTHPGPRPLRRSAPAPGSGARTPPLSAASRGLPVWAGRPGPRRSPRTRTGGPAMAAPEETLRRRKAGNSGPEPETPPESGRDPTGCPARLRTGTFWLTRIVLLRALAFIYCESAEPGAAVTVAPVRTRLHLHRPRTPPAPGRCPPLPSPGRPSPDALPPGAPLPRDVPPLTPFPRPAFPGHPFPRGTPPPGRPFPDTPPLGRLPWTPLPAPPTPFP